MKFDWDTSIPGGVKELNYENLFKFHVDAVILSLKCLCFSISLDILNHNEYNYYSFQAIIDKIYKFSDRLSDVICSRLPLYLWQK